ncbi:MAG: hypothetical protein R3C11_14795 [Planctomycetaceae bacterium]
MGNGGAASIWFDQNTSIPEERYKMLADRELFSSPDGIHWEHVMRFGKSGDRSTFFYNPFRQKWVYSIKAPLEWMLDRGRTRLYFETDEFFSVPEWAEVPGASEGNVVMWTATDSKDEMWEGVNVRPELYALDSAAYESLMLGLFVVWKGDTPEIRNSGRPKLNQVFVGFSRDGFHWDRPDRTPYLPITNEVGAWNWGNVQSCGGCCLIVRDKLYFYCGGRAGSQAPGSTDHSAGSSTGLAMMRRDGFASIDAGKETGTLTTRPIQFKGKHLFVNVDAPQGELRAEVLDETGNVLPEFSFDNCEPIRADETLLQVRWKNDPDLSQLAGQPVRIRFQLTNGSLYSFWVSPDKSGASHGYIAAGGPGYVGHTDTVGRKALEMVE